MSASEARRRPAMLHGWPPTGVGLLLAGSVVLAIYTIWGLSPGLSDPPPHGWNETSARFAPLSIGILLLLILSAVGVWFRSRIARVLYLVCLAFLLYVYVDSDFATIPFLIDYAGKHPGYETPVRLAFSTTFFALRGPVWMLLNLWYFLGPRTRAFFARKDGGSTT